MEKIIVSATGIIGIFAIYWFFFGKTEKNQEKKTSWTILVKGGYQPATVTIPAGVPSTIIFTRTDPNSCLEDVMIEDFKIKKFLPMNTPVTITVSPTKSGTYKMHCGMNMFHGRIVVV